MIAPPAPPAFPSPLSELDHDDRAHVIDAIAAGLDRPGAVTVLTALAGSREEIRQLPFRVQEDALSAILSMLPPGHNAIVASRLGLAMKSDEEYLDEILTEQEKADPEFQQRLEQEARFKGIQRWLVALHMRYDQLSPDELGALIQRHVRADGA